MTNPSLIDSITTIIILTEQKSQTLPFTAAQLAAFTVMAHFLIFLFIGFIVTFIIWGIIE